MTKQSTTILVLLILLTFVGLVLVSNLISEKKPSEAALSAALLAGSPKASPAPSLRPVSSGETVADDLHFAQAQLDSLQDAISNNDWTKAQTLFAGFELKDRRLPSPQLRHPDISPLFQDFFDLYVVQLERAISEKHAKNAVFAINQLASIVNETNTRFVKRSTPVEVQRLHHLVREMSFWKDAGDEKMLRVRTAALYEAWNDISPIVRSRKQGEGVAQQLDGLLKQATTAETPGQINTLLPEISGQLEQVDSLFESRPGGTGDLGKQDDN